MQVSRGGEKRIRPDEAPLPPRNRFAPSRVPETLIYDYPEQLYTYRYKSGRNIESIIVKKLGDRTVREEGTSVDRVLSQQEYDALEPLNAPDRKGRFDTEEGYGPIQRRDFAMDQALHSVVRSELLSEEDLLSLAKTNTTVASRVLESDAFLSSFNQAYFLLNHAIRENNLFIVKLALDSNIIEKTAEEYRNILFTTLLNDCIETSFDPPGYRGVRESVQLLMTHPSTRQFHNRPDLNLQTVYENCVTYKCFANLKYIFQYIKNPQFLNIALLTACNSPNREDEIDFLVNHGAALIVQYALSPNIYGLIKHYNKETYALISHCVRGRSNKERREFFEAYHQNFKCAIALALQLKKWDVVRLLLGECRRNYGFTNTELRENRYVLTIPNRDSMYTRFLDEYRYFLLSIAIHSEYRQPNGETKLCEAPPNIVLEVLDNILAVSLSTPPTVREINSFGSYHDVGLSISHPLFYCNLRKEESETIASKLFSLGVNPVYLQKNTDQDFVNPFFHALQFTPNVKLIEAYCTFDFKDNNFGGYGDEYNQDRFVRGKLDVNKIKSKLRTRPVNKGDNIRFSPNSLTFAMKNKTHARNSIIKYLVEHKFFDLNKVSATLPTGLIDVSVAGVCTELDAAKYGLYDEPDDYHTNLELQKKKHEFDTDMYMYLLNHGARFTCYMSVASFAFKTLLYVSKAPDGEGYAYSFGKELDFGPFDYIYSRSTKKTQNKMLWVIIKDCLEANEQKFLDIAEHLMEKYKFNVNYYEEDLRDRMTFAHDSEGYIDEFAAIQPLLNYVLEDPYIYEPGHAMKLVQELLDEGASTRIKCYTVYAMQNGYEKYDKRDALELAKDFQQTEATRLTEEPDNEESREMLLEATSIVQLITMYRAREAKP